MKMLPLLLFSCLLCTAHPGLAKNTLVPPDTARVFHQVDSLMSDWVKQGKIPGLVAGVTYRGKIVYLRAFGQQSAGGPPMTTESIFRLASMTKPLTSASAALLIQRGKLHLDDPVARYLPEFSELTTVAGDQIPVGDSALRVRHLLTHTAGFSYGIFDTAMAKYYTPLGIVDAFTLDTVTLAENIRQLAKAPLAHKPGEKWTYGLSIDVLGRVVEVASGKKLSDFMRENFFRPLHMDETAFHLSEDHEHELIPVSYFAQGKWAAYAANADTRQFTQYPVEGARTYEAPGGGLCGTASDYLQFSGMLAQAGKWGNKRVLDSATVIMMGSNTLANPVPDWTGFGFGMAIQPAKDVALKPGRPGRMEWSGLFNTYFFTDPSEELSAVLMTQQYPGSQSEIFEPFARLLYQLAKH